MDHSKESEAGSEMSDDEKSSPPAAKKMKIDDLTSKLRTFIPITLTGSTLGERHRCFNALVQEASAAATTFKHITSLPENSPLDRLFKIDLAIKQKNVDFIIQNIKDDDMLYVSRALKAKWLVEHPNLINPKYLEETLYPEMIMPAVSKLKHWLYINLRDPATCEAFYQYNEDKDFDYAVKFLSHCSNEFILNKFPDIMIEMSPQRLKVLSEKCPQVAKFFFDTLASNDALKRRCYDDSRKYYKKIKFLLKTDPELFLDITENYNLNVLNKLGRSSTDFIMREHKSRFMAKPEFYVVALLHLPTVAKCLSEEECEQLILKLGRAKFLRYWFNYKAVEPLLQRLPPSKRAALKKRVFVDKDFGELVDHWPYTVSEWSYALFAGGNATHAFVDQNYYSPITMYRISPLHRLGSTQCRLRSGYMSMCMKRGGRGKAKKRCEFQRLFDEYRFVGFKQAMYELGRRYQAAGSAERRRDMMLVLVSKAGACAEHVEALLRLSARRANEPAPARAAVLRSLVRRARVWRLAPRAWQELLALGRGLGLDGTAPEVPCHEGLHAVVLRQLLANGHCEPAIFQAYLGAFSTLAEYSLTAEEKRCVVAALGRLLITSAAEAEPAVAAAFLGREFDVLKAYGIRIDGASEIVGAVKSLVPRDSAAARPLLKRLYDMRVARRECFEVNLEFRRDDASLVNILRHEPTAFSTNTLVEIMASSKTDRFIKKLAVYFNEKEGFADRLGIAIKERIYEEPAVKLAGPLASLLGSDFEATLRELDLGGEIRKRFAAVLRANTHRTRPSPNVLAWGWSFAGVKALATYLYRGRLCVVSDEVLTLAAERRTSRLALQLCKRIPSVIVDVYTIVSTKRPSIALRGSLSHFEHNGAASGQVWEIIKPLILNIDLTSRGRLQSKLDRSSWMPIHIQPDYCAIIYLALHKFRYWNYNPTLNSLMDFLPTASPELVENVLTQMLQVDIDTEESKSEIRRQMIFPALFIRYLLLSTSEEEQERRLVIIGQPFMEHLDYLRKEYPHMTNEIMKQTIDNLRLNKVCLDIKYVSSLPVLQRFHNWMQTFLSKEENLELNVLINLSIMYVATLRQSVEQMPEVFEDPKLKATEGLRKVGLAFGKCIAKEISQLVVEHFDSIIELYAVGLNEYLSSYYHCCHKETKGNFVAKVIEGYFSESVGMQRRLAIYVSNDCLKKKILNEIQFAELKSMIEKDRQLNILINAEKYSCLLK